MTYNIANIEKLLDKSEVLTLLCTRTTTHWSFIKFCFQIPLVFTSSAMCIINSITLDANEVKIPNIIINAISVLIISINNNVRASEKYELFKQRILESPAIYSVARAGNEFGQAYHITDEEEFNGVKKTFQLMVADPDFVETMGLEMVEGRNYKFD